MRAVDPIDKLSGWALSGMLSATRRCLLSSLIKDAKNPAQAQHRLLKRIVSQNADTEFGCKHGFASVGHQREWNQSVPFQEYEDLRPWIDRQIKGVGRPPLTHEAPIMYAMTSGTTSKPKLIPVTQSGLQRQRRMQRIFASALYGCDPSIFAGRIFGISSPAVEGRLANGAPFGSVSGVIYRQTPTLIRSRYLLPADVFEIADYDSKYRAIATYMLAEETVTLATAANPSSFLRLLSVIEEYLDVILADVAEGRNSAAPQLTRWSARKERARSLSQLADKKGRLDLSDIWPRLKGIVTWTGGSCGVALGALRPRLGHDARIYEFGYAASEFRGTINVDPEHNLCLPALNDVYFEFVEQSRWDDEPRDFRTLDELELGKRYMVVATTQDGLYRYHINDVVEVVGFIENTPALAFVQKGQGVTNITGEKITEAQIREAVTSAEISIGDRLLFYMALADEDRQGYDIYVEPEGEITNGSTFAATIDRALCDTNIEYRDKRNSGRLTPIRVIILRQGTEDAYRRHTIASGQREGQYKVLPLGYASKMTFDFTAWVRR